MYKIRLTPYAKIFYNEWLLAPHSSRYNITMVQTLHGKIDIFRLKYALTRYIKERVILNSHIEVFEGEPYWVPTNLVNELEYTDNIQTDEAILAYVSKGFDLSVEGGYRFKLIKLDDNKHLFINVYHHIVLDGASGNKAIYESISNYYNHLSYTEKYTTVQQIELLKNLSDNLTNNLHKNQSQYKNFWQNKLSDIDSINLRFLKANNQLTPPSLNPTIKEIRFSFDHTIVEDISKVTRRYVITPYIYGLCIFAIILYRYTNQETFAISYPISIKEGINYILGAQVNTNLIPFYISRQTTIMDLFQQSREFFKSIKRGDLNYGYYPITHIMQLSSKTLLDVSFVQTNLKDALFNFNGIDKVEIVNKFNIDSVVQLAPTDYTRPLFFEQELKHGKLNYRLRYEQGFFDHHLVENFIANYKKIFTLVLEELLSQKQLLPISSYSILSTQEQFKITHNFNDTARPYCLAKTIHHVFEEQVHLTPNNLAVIYEEIHLTYWELNILSNKLAHYLVNNFTLKPDHLIVLCLNRSEYMLAIILAILKSGTAYVPIDPEFPENRIRYIIKDTNTHLIITNNIFYDKLARIIEGVNTYTSLIAIEDIQPKLLTQPDYNLDNKVSPNTLAYVIYTSGSTGVPKGVMIEHTSVINRIRWMNETHPLTYTDRILQKTPYTFDVSVWELFWGIWYGACVVFAKPDGHKDMEYLARIINKELITIIHFVPSMLVMFGDYIRKNKTSLNSLKKLFCSGEILHVNPVQELKKLLPHVLIHNLYGPTEATIDVTSYNCTQNEHVYIGTPIANTKIYIIDKNLHLLPIGVVGELCISGIGLARGYLNLTEETSKRFIPNPFQSIEEKKLNINSKLYRTGDLARFLPDGNLEYCGRQDNQIKLRGYRIELSEIEALVNSYPSVKQSLAVFKDYPSMSTYANKRIVVYYTSFVDNDQNHLNNYINHWQSVYQDIYKNMNLELPEDNFSGWHSSYTGIPLELSHMREWLSSITKHIKMVNPFNILELGSGSGAIMLSCIDFCNYYYASDFSTESTDYIHNIVIQKKLNDKVAVINCGANNIPYSNITDPLDTVVLNSVIQYFPNIEYLQQLINSLIHNLDNLRYIVIGDIRDYRLLDTFYYSVLTYKYDIARQSSIEFYKNREKELLISPRYFISLMQTLSEIDHIEFLIKECDLLNELTQFRYDLILHIKNINFSQKDEYYELEADKFIQVPNLELYIDQHKNSNILLVKYPYKNSYIEHIKYLTFKNQDSTIKRGYVIENILSVGNINILAKKYQFIVKFYLDIDDTGYLNLVFYKPEKINSFKIIYANHANKKEQLFNNPAQTVKLLESELSNNIKHYLEQRLPSYMMPDALVYIDTFPVTVNGKMDIEALPEPEEILTENYKAPTNKIELKICNAFSKVLSVSQKYIGINHDFFKSGGNSILAIKLAIELQHDFKVGVSAIFLHRTPEELAKYVTAKEGFLFKQLQQLKQLYKNRSDSDIITHEILAKREQYFNQIKTFTFEQQKKCIRAIILTGATGHVGCNILYQLLIETTYKIYLLARSTPEVSARTRINNKFNYYFGDDLEKYKDRIIIFDSDLEQPYLGLTNTQYKELEKEVDSIIHAAGYVKYYGEYDAFYKSNVYATTNLLELARQTRLKNFHYISTIGVFMDGYVPDNQYYEFNEDDNPAIIMNRSNLYVQTKYAGEVEVQKYQELGVVANIYRLGNTAMDSLSYRHQENLEDNAFFMQVKAIAQLGIIAPELDNVEITPVDYATRSIVKIFDQKFLFNRVYHVFNPFLYKLSDLLNSSYKQIKLCSINQFIDEVLAQLANNNNNEQISLFMLHQLWLKDVETKNITSVKILNNKTIFVLERLGVHLPVITPPMLQEFII